MSIKMNPQFKRVSGVIVPRTVSDVELPSSNLTLSDGVLNLTNTSVGNIAFNLTQNADDDTFNIDEQRAIDICNGVVLAVTDEEIKDAKALVGRYGLGCEPASAATIAGLKHLRKEGVIAADEKVVCVLTGHPLKDPELTVNYHQKKQGQFSNPPIEAPNDLDEIIKLIG